MVSVTREPTIWNEFMERREEGLQPFIFGILTRTLLGWLGLSALTLVPIAMDERTRPVFMRVLIIKLSLTALLIAAIFLAKFNCLREQQRKIGLTALLGTFMCVHFLQAVLVDRVVRTRNLYSSNDENAATVLASRILGPHQALFLAAAFSSVRLVVTDKRHLLGIFVLVPLFCILAAVAQATAIDGKLTYGTTTYRDIYPYAMVLGALVINYGSVHLWIQTEWREYVTRKRLQLECIRVEELLKLVMPKEIAHQQMKNRLVPKTYERVSVAFIYFTGYKELNQRASKFETVRTNDNDIFLYDGYPLHCTLSFRQTETEADICDLMDTLNFHVAKLDSLVLQHEGVYKIESVANCYMVAAGVPHESPHHVDKVLRFCLEVLTIYRKGAIVVDDQFHESKADDNVHNLEVKIGIQCGPVTTAIIGKSRTFYRIFGDTVNVASRIANCGESQEIRVTQSVYEQLGCPPLGVCKVVEAGTCRKPKARYRVSASHLCFLKGKGNQNAYVIEPETPILDENSENTETASTRARAGHGQKSPRRKSRNGEVTPAVYSDEKETDALGSHHWEGEVDQSQYLTDNENSYTLENTRQTIASASILLSISYKDSLWKYKTASSPAAIDTTLSYVREVEAMGVANLKASLGSKRLKRQRRLTESDVFLETKFSPEVSQKGAENVGKMGETSGQGSTGYDTPAQDETFDDSKSKNVSIFPPLAREANIIDETFTPTTIQRCKTVHACLSKWFGALPIAYSKFSDHRLESIFETYSNAILYALLLRGFVYMTIGLLLVMLLETLAIPTEDIWAYVIFCGVAFIILTGNKAIKRFKVLEEKDSLEFVFGMDTVFNCGLEENGLSDTVSHRTHSTDNDSGSQWMTWCIRELPQCRPCQRVRNLTQDLSSWFVVAAWCISAIFFSADHAIGMKYAQTEDSACLRSFVFPVIVISTFQLIRVRLRAHLFIQLGSIFILCLVFFSSGSMVNCNKYLLGVGFFYLLAIVVNGILDAVSSEVRTRRTLVLYCASKLASKQADNVIHRLFPHSVANTLKAGEPLPFEVFQHEVIILWGDLVGFTELASNVSSFHLMELLHDLYSGFDELVDQYNVWKMDTIGDAYVVVSGMHDSEMNHHHYSNAIDSVFSVAVGILQLVKEFNARHDLDVGIRMGIHCGQVGAGIVGSLRPRFYVFGNTVIEAERLESTSQRNKIQLSKDVAQLYRANQFMVHPRDDVSSRRYSFQDSQSDSAETYWLHIAE